MKNSSGTIGNRTRDLPACSAVPQPIAPSPNPGYRKKERLFPYIELISWFYDRDGVCLLRGTNRVFT
jgi:hypothetical protein